MTMSCKQAEALIAAYADGEVDALRSYSIKHHLRDCSSCAARYRSVLELRERIRTEVPYFVAPPTLLARVSATVGSVPAPPRPTSERWRWLTGGVLVAGTATLFAWMIDTTIVAWRANEDFAIAAVAAHVRATLGDHLIEVASSDRHRVKPWLSARLDYSPPVQDLASDGFALIGGRLDYLERRPVATLVYRYREHTIDVFVRPGASGATMAALPTVRGFNVARASGPSMDWLGVSDAESAVVSALVQRLAREDIPQ
jgi:anti-sigma factor RsiW